MTVHEAEAIVVGGGPAGAAAALTRARGGRSVLLIDDARAAAPGVGEALPPAATPLLRSLGVLGYLAEDGHLPCVGNASVWGSPQAVTTSFIFDPNGHGWHLDRARFDARLRGCAAEAGAELVAARVTGVAEDGAGWRLRLQQDGQAAEACGRWLIDATGRRSAVGRWLGAVRRRDDALVAFHARFRPSAGTAPDRDDRTLVEAEPGGWWYTARVPPGERVIAFLTDADLADRRLLKSMGGFLARIEEGAPVHCSLLQGAYEIVGQPRGTDASSARLHPFAGAGWLAVGDAALSFDPLSSQGLLNALYTGVRGSEAVATALAGDASGVAAYGERLLQIHGAYRANYAHAYETEGRWPEAPFWRRRSGVEV